MLKTCLPVLVAVLALAHAAAAEEMDSAQTLPISEALMDRDGDTVPDRINQRVRVRGVVTVPPGTIADAFFHCFLQDETGGIALFNRLPESTPLHAGDVVEAYGTVEQYRGAVQLGQPVYRIVGRVAPPEPIDATVAEAASWKSYGRLVRVHGLFGKPRFESAVEIPLRDGGRSIDVFLSRKVAHRFVPTEFPPGSEVSVIGVVSIRSMDKPFLEGFELIIRDPGEISVVSKASPRWIFWVLLCGGMVIAAGILGFIVIEFVVRRRRRRERRLAVVDALATAIQSTYSEDEFMESVTRLLVDGTLVHAATIHLLDSQNDLKLRHSAGLGEDVVRLLGEGRVLPRVKPEIAGQMPHQTPPEENAAMRAVRETGLNVVARLPLVGRMQTHGLLTLYAKGDQTPTSGDARVMISAAGLISFGLDNLSMTKSSEARETELKQLAITDDLTGLYNRRFLDEYLRIQLAMAKRQQTRIAFLSIDIDHFKLLNDSHGHATGDSVLVKVGELFRNSIRASDLAVRIGGEEFLIVIPDTDQEGAITFAERLREQFAAKEFSSDPPVRLTVSIGVAIYPDEGSIAPELLQIADEALYRSKREGRNRVTCGSAPRPMTRKSEPSAQ